MKQTTRNIQHYNLSFAYKHLYQNAAVFLILIGQKELICFYIPVPDFKMFFYILFSVFILNKQIK